MVQRYFMNEKRLAYEKMFAPQFMVPERYDLGRNSLMPAGCGHHGASLTPDEIIRDARVDLLADESYFFPANGNEKDPTVFLPLRKWDIIFVGQTRQFDAETNYLSLLIPGKFDPHTRVRGQRLQWKCLSRRA
jgi:hypothetical protein